MASNSKMIQIGLLTSLWQVLLGEHQIKENQWKYILQQGGTLHTHFKDSFVFIWRKIVKYDNTSKVLTVSTPTAF